jgi:hypothetical protein
MIDLTWIVGVVYGNPFACASLWPSSQSSLLQKLLTYGSCYLPQANEHELMKLRLFVTRKISPVRTDTIYLDRSPHCLVRNTSSESL